MSITLSTTISMLDHTGDCVGPIANAKESPGTTQDINEGEELCASSLHLVSLQVKVNCAHSELLRSLFVWAGKSSSVLVQGWYPLLRD